MTHLRYSAGVLGVALTMAAASIVAAQSSNTFEAATLKVNKNGGTQIRLDILSRSGRINAINVPMRTLLAAAFRVRGEQIVNAPAWVDRTRVDLVAKVDPTLTSAQIIAMLAPLLEDLAKLKVHRDMRDMDVYALELVKPGQLGPNLKRSPNDCGGGPGSSVPLNQTAPSSGPLINPDAQPKRPDGTPMCGPVPGGPGHVIQHGVTMDGWTNWMTGLRMADRPVVDETGLQGAWDLDVKYTPDALSSAALAARGANVPPGLAALASQVDPDGPTLRQALEDQLGLKLERKTMAREVIVVDQIEIPVE